MKMLDKYKHPNDVLWDFTKSYQGFILSIRIQDGIPRDNKREEQNKTSDKQKTPDDFSLKFMRSYQDLTFSTRIQDGILRGNQSDKKENVWQTAKT